MKGKIIEWHDAKGYGFISSSTANQKLFFHVSSVETRNHRPAIGDEVEYIIAKDSNGRSNASGIVITNAKLVSIKAVLGFSFIIAVCASTVVLNGHTIFVPIYLLLSWLTYHTYARDKKAAQEQQRRTPENSLHILALLGGWPGALFAQNQLKHKSKKQPFKSILWVTVIINSSFYIWQLTPAGQSLFQQVLDLLLRLFNIVLTKS